MPSPRKCSELRPDRNMLDPNFDGYKLSLEPVPTLHAELHSHIASVRLTQDQYSLLHTRLFTLHNHLVSDPYHDEDVYFIDQSGTVQHCTVNEDSIIQRATWNMPVSLDESRKGIVEAYNTSISFSSESNAVISDGCGKLYIADSGSNRASTWTTLFEDQVLLSRGYDGGFVVLHTRCEIVDDSRHIHCILAHIEYNDEIKHFQTALNWITISESRSDSNSSTWTLSAYRKLEGRGCVYYAALEANCHAIYIASDYEIKFINDSESEIIIENGVNVAKPKVYQWQQTNDEITIKLSLDPSENDKKLVQITTQPLSLSVRYGNRVIFEFQNLWQRVDAELTTWELHESSNLHVTLIKSEENQMWMHLLDGGDEYGEQIFDADAVNATHERLAHLCSEKEVTSTGYTFTDQQMEECDALPDDQFTTLERISKISHKSTHSVSLSGYPILFSKILSNNEAIPAICARYDVDACLWQPNGSESDWRLIHTGTLHAFGFVQASKTQRKFMDCSPDMSYAVVCEPTRHAFIYRQSRRITDDCQLRNRNSGRHVKAIAQQQVLELDGEVLGLCAQNKYLYLLTTNKIYAYLINELLL